MEKKISKKIFVDISNLKLSVSSFKLSVSSFKLSGCVLVSVSEPKFFRLWEWEPLCSAQRLLGFRLRVVFERIEN